MAEMNLRHSGFIYSGCGLFTIKRKNTNKYSKKQEIHDIFIKWN